MNPARIADAYLASIVCSVRSMGPKERSALLTYQARTALAHLCRRLRIGSGDEVLVPAYNCGAEVDPYIKCGAVPVLYRIDKQLRIDADDIKKRATRSTRVLHVTHFYGWPQEIKELAGWCETRGIYLIEDCAQALYSEGPERTIGKTGDAAIYSFPKSLPVPDGGAAILNRGNWNSPPVLRVPPSGTSLMNCLPLIKKWFMNSCVFWQRNPATLRLIARSWKCNLEKTKSGSRQVMLPSNYLVEGHMPWTMSRVTQGLMDAAKRDLIIRTRRNHYLYLLEALGDTPGAVPIFASLPDGVCPQAFPILVDDRKRWYEGLESRGIEVQGWPGFYPALNWDEYPEACMLKERLLGLPVHQNLGIRHLEHIVNCVHTISRQAQNL